MTKAIIPDNLKEVKGCVFKLYYGKYYIIVMGRSLKWQVEMISGDIERSYRGKSVGDLYNVFSRYVAKFPVHQFSFELLYESENPFNLLVRCQEEIDDSIGDKYCLNSECTPFLSKRIQTPPIYLKWKDKYWINRGHYLNFRKWQYSRYVI